KITANTNTAFRLNNFILTIPLNQYKCSTKTNCQSCIPYFFTAISIVDIDARLQPKMNILPVYCVLLRILAKLLPCDARHGVILSGASSQQADLIGTASLGKGVRREVESEGS